MTRFWSSGWFYNRRKFVEALWVGESISHVREIEIICDYKLGSVDFNISTNTLILQLEEVESNYSPQVYMLLMNSIKQKWWFVIEETRSHKSLWLSLYSLFQITCSGGSSYHVMNTLKWPMERPTEQDLRSSLANSQRGTAASCQEPCRWAIFRISK